MKRKQDYRRPSLVVYGTVRNLTGGSGAMGGDAFSEAMGDPML